MMNQLWFWLFPKHKIRKNYVCCEYRIAEDLLKKGWTLAKEEDNNHKFGFVCLELLEECK